jgi:hypothetical protein
MLLIIIMISIIMILAIDIIINKANKKGIKINNIIIIIIYRYNKFITYKLL